MNLMIIVCTIITCTNFNIDLVISAFWKFMFLWYIIIYIKETWIFIYWIYIYMFIYIYISIICHENLLSWQIFLYLLPKINIQALKCWLWTMTNVEVPCLYGFISMWNTNLYTEMQFDTLQVSLYQRFNCSYMSVEVIQTKLYPMLKI